MTKLQSKHAKIDSVQKLIEHEDALKHTKAQVEETRSERQLAMQPACPRVVLITGSERRHPCRHTTNQDKNKPETKTHQRKANP